MKKSLFLFLSTFLLCACATVKSVDWTGQNFDNFVIQYGAPSSQYVLQNGDTAYSFSKPCPYTQGQQEVVVVVGPDSTINRVTRVTSCPSDYEEKRHNEYVDPQTNFLKEQAAKEAKEAQYRRKQMLDRINILKTELFNLEYNSDYSIKARSVEERIAFYEDFFKKYPHLLELNKQQGHETDIRKMAQEEFEKDQPALKELEERRARLQAEITALEMQLPPEQKDGFEILIDKWF